MELGDRLKRLREEKNISQLELAKLLNISNVMLSRYEKNKRSPDYQTLINLADFYKVTTDYLLGRTNIRSPENFVAADSQSEYDKLPPEIYNHLKKVAQYFIEKEKHQKNNRK